MAQVNLTTTKNIKLKTKGLYCDEDIEVVPNLQTKEVTPAEVEKEVSADSGFSGLGKVKVNAVPTNYVGSAINQLEAQTYTPTTSDQEIASGQYLRGTQIIKGDANLAAENIAKDVEIFGIVGTHEGGKQPVLQDKEVTPTKETQIVMADTGYDGLNSTTVKPIPEEYIIPAGELEITENNTTYDVTDKKTVIVNVPTGGGGSNEKDPNETMYEMQEADYMRYLQGQIIRNEIPSDAEYLEQQEYVNSAIFSIMGE